MTTPLALRKGLAFREKLRKGQHVVGAWSTLANTSAAALMAHAGLDFLLIDLEHGRGDAETVSEQVAALMHLPTAVIVRPPDHSPGLIKRILDAGANGLMIPMVETVEQASAIVHAACFHPLGARGVAVGAIQASDFGYLPVEYFNQANDALTLILQIETATAVANARQLATIPHVHGFFIGPSDLSAGLGIFRQFKHQAFIDSIDAIRRATAGADAVLGTIPHDGKDATTLLQEGYRFVIGTSDQEMLRKGSASLVEAARRLAPKAAD